MYHKGLTFAPGQLNLYLRRIKEWGKKEYEISIALICLKMYKDVTPGEYFIAFPPKMQYEKELGKTHILSTEQLREFLNKYWDENTITDVTIFRRNPKEDLFKIPIQIKRFGLGKELGGNTKNFIMFLRNLQKLPYNENRLVILRENVKRLKPQEIVDWLNRNKFPFPEVILLHQKPNMDMELYQLKPNNGTFSTRVLTKNQIMDMD